MARIAASLKLGAAEIDALMRSESRLRSATIGPGAAINLTPMTFGWAGGRVYVYGRGQKIANLRRNPTATVLVDTGYAASAAGRSRRWVVFTSTTSVSWNNEKLP